VAELVNNLEKTLRTYRQLPRTKMFLPSLYYEAFKALTFVKRLLRYYPEPSTIYGALLNFQTMMNVNLDFLQGLQRYDTKEGKDLVYRALNQRIHMQEGVLLAGVFRAKLHEKLDPQHRRNTDLEDEFQKWLHKEINEGRDPAENIVDFFLGYDSEVVVRPYMMSTDRLSSSQIKFKDGLVYAYYCDEAMMDGGEWRNGKVHYNVEGYMRMRYDLRAEADYRLGPDLVSVYLDKYDSAGATLPRGGGDFRKGDAYVVGANGKFYSFGGNIIHSEFFSADDVQAAGLWVARGGKIQAIDNRSGHYRPGWKNLHQAVTALKNQNVFDRDAIVGLVVSPESTMFFTVKDFSDLAALGFPFGETVRVVRGYQGFYKAKGGIPVPPSKLEYLPDELKQGWSNDGKRWDQFFKHFYTKDKVRGVPMDWAP